MTAEDSPIPLKGCTVDRLEPVNVYKLVEHERTSRAQALGVLGPTRARPYVGGPAPMIPVCPNHLLCQIADHQ